MRIQHNIAALNTHRNLAFNNTQTSKALEKLSSGYKINRAGDDAAGLAISEKMRGQIRGLDMASKNAQDGISLIQTAEGALNETHSILQRMRELAVQAGNDTNTTGDREEIQKEINQLTSEINRIGNTTEFNTKKLVNGDLSAKFETSAAVEGAVTGEVSQLLAKDQTIKVGDSAVTLTGVSGKPDFNFEIAGKADNGLDWSKLDTTSGNSIIVTRNADVSGKASFSVDIEATDKSGNKLTVTADQMAFDAASNTYTYDNQGVKFSIDKADVDKWKVGGTIELNLNTAAGTGTSAVGTHNTLETKEPFTYTAGTSGDGTAPTLSDIKITGSQWEGLDEIKIDYDEAKAGTTSGLTVTLTNASGKSATYQFSVDATSGAQTKIEVEGISFTFTAGKPDTSGDSTATGTFAVETETKKTQIKEADKAAETEDRSLKFQIGANKDQAIAVSLEDMRAAALGITTAGTDEKFGVTDGTNSTIKEQSLNVSTHEDAAKAIKTFDDAITKVSAERSKLGAVQNRLEHTINNLGTSSENLTAAESRIRDTDMAASMMEFTKNNILTQAAQSMLAQANQQPQGVLQLLG